MKVGRPEVCWFQGASSVQTGFDLTFVSCSGERVSLPAALQLAGQRQRAGRSADQPGAAGQTPAGPTTLP